MTLTADKDICPREEIAAYLDGELSGVALETFEAHLNECSDCAGELRSQRQLLCTLDAAFSSSLRIKLPENFTRVVATHAEHNLRGLREKSERRRALQLCAMLAVTAFALLGAASGALVLQPARNSLRIVARLLEVLSQAVLEAAEGFAIIGRMIGQAAVASPYGIGALIAFVFIGSVFLLPRLIASYHRTQIIE
ncbi:MAG TPA: anti-sigma factor [Pyrinomonadaceae bacterium]|nr:anti-sigma factor [Pyrinomonadaceae bacterium]